MDEFSFIRSIQPRYYRQPSLIKGISDDGAVIRPFGEDFVTAVDTMVEGVHFTKETMPPFYIGHRVLAANISDLAAMGSTPVFYMVSITIPHHWREVELKSLYEGMKLLADDYQMDLIGGDTVSGRDLSVTVTVMGTVAKNKARYRSAARPGDILFVTGTLGDSRGGLEWLLHEERPQSEDAAYLVKRHRSPEPRVAFAENLAHLSRMALNDVSDGIANEANEIAEASDVDLEIAADKLPYSDALANCYPDQYEEWLLSGGEDFELLGTIPEEDWPSIQEAADKTGVAVTKIGRVTQKNGDVPCVRLRRNHRVDVLGPSGYTHLKGEDE
ncbi:thiamine-phosphate kinase [Halobacillus litoralis]|uniref:thiamine-phosphate kinase n=1 Tax=Halobacillus litoralis TaxID=45668 RepID=UPI001CFEB807|nr:thiamine-phosphate kinase [Halobacillus litoralis]